MPISMPHFRRSVVGRPVHEAAHNAITDRVRLKRLSAPQQPDIGWVSLAADAVAVTVELVAVARVTSVDRGRFRCTDSIAVRVRDVDRGGRRWCCGHRRSFWCVCFGWWCRALSCGGRGERLEPEPVLVDSSQLGCIVNPELRTERGRTSVGLADLSPYLSPRGVTDEFISVRAPTYAVALVVVERLERRPETEFERPPYWFGAGVVVASLPPELGDGETPIELYVLSDGVTRGVAGQGPVPTDSCRWRNSWQTPGKSVAELADALVAIPGRQATTPVPITVGGHEGLYFEWSLPANLDITTCDDEKSVAWTGAAQTRSHDIRGLIDRIWILDVDGQRILIDVLSLPVEQEVIRQRVDEVIDSLRFAANA
jgi:hypothetical protein